MRPLPRWRKVSFASVVIRKIGRRGLTKCHSSIKQRQFENFKRHYAILSKKVPVFMNSDCVVLHKYRDTVTNIDSTAITLASASFRGRRCHHRCAWLHRLSWLAHLMVWFTGIAAVLFSSTGIKCWLWPWQGHQRITCLRRVLVRNREQEFWEQQPHFFSDPDVKQLHGQVGAVNPRNLAWLVGIKDICSL